MSVNQPFHIWLERTVTAHERGAAGGAPFQTALREVEAGKKREHWSWYVFPQWDGLGRSATSREFGVPSVEAAVAFLTHPTTGPNYMDIVRAAVTHLENGLPLSDLLGPTDAKKFISSLTLMQGAAQRHPRVLRVSTALELTKLLTKVELHGNSPCAQTLAWLADH